MGTAEKLLTEPLTNGAPPSQCHSHFVDSTLFQALFDKS